MAENRKLNNNGDNRFTINGMLQTLHDKKQVVLKNTKYAHLAGNVPGSDIGYYFPTATDLKILKEKRTANWNSICGNPAMSDTVIHTNHFLTLWFDHGINPSGATYSYVLLPGFSSFKVAQYAQKPPVVILRNDTLVQAVWQTKLNIIAANFWTDSEQHVGIIGCNKKASVLVKNSIKSFEVCVADPTKNNKGSIRVVIDKAVKSVLNNDARISVMQLSPQLILNINFVDALGSYI